VGKSVDLKDTTPGYWDNYNNFQRVKHDLIRNYLNGWFPKLSSWHGKIVYFDTHAGRGKHSGGQYGSPIVALQTLMEHSFRDRLLSNCEVLFAFCEGDKGNFEKLVAEIDALGKLPDNIKINAANVDCYKQLGKALLRLEEENKELAPAFVFVDPYGFKMPGSILKRLMTFKRVELFINVIWRELNMAISNGSKQEGMAKTLDSIFDGNVWRDLVPLNSEERSEGCMALFKDMVDAQWATYIYMRGKNHATRYMLLHLTNHDDGRDLMKDCIWKVCPDGGFHASVTGLSADEYLIKPEPDLRPLQNWVIKRLGERPYRWQELLQDVRSKIWRQKHLNDVVRSLRRDGIIDKRDHKGKFHPCNNPELFLIEVE